MFSTLFFTIALLGTTTSAAGTPRTPWETVFEGERGPDGWVSGVAALARDDFFVAGGWGITRATAGRVERRDTPGHAIFGLVDANPDGIFALGAGELVLHFDGKTWTEEHAGAAVPPRTKSANTLLYSAFQTCSDPNEIAFGPKLVLERQRDLSWRAASGDDRERLWDLVRGWASSAVARPSRCDAGSWFWLGKGGRLVNVPGRTDLHVRVWKADAWGEQAGEVPDALGRRVAKRQGVRVLRQRHVVGNHVRELATASTAEGRR